MSAIGAEPGVAFDVTEFETRHGGIWRIAAIADYWSKLELGYHVTTTQNHRDAIETAEQALRESERLLGQPLADWLTDELTGEIRPVVLVTDNGLRFKSAHFASFIERAFGSLKYDHLYRREIDDGNQLGVEVDRYCELLNTVRPHQALGGLRSLDVHLAACKTRSIIKSTGSPLIQKGPHADHGNMSSRQPTPPRP